MHGKLSLSDQIELNFLGYTALDGIRAYNDDDRHDKIWMMILLIKIVIMAVMMILMMIIIRQSHMITLMQLR